MAYRSANHSSTKETPYFMLFGRDMTLPYELMTQEAQPLYNYDDYKERLARNMQNTHKIVQEKLEESADKQVAARAKVARPREFKVGERVLLYTPQVKKEELKNYAN